MKVNRNQKNRNHQKKSVLSESSPDMTEVVSGDSHIQKNKKNFKQKITDLFDLPREIMLNMFKVTIVGKEQLIIENFTGISEYDDTNVKINTPGGIVEISGAKLVIREISVEDILIKGHIHKIEFF